MSVESPTGRVEGVGARRTTDGLALVPAHPLQASLPALRHRVASTATRLLRGYHEATTRATATRLLRGYYEAASYQATTRLLTTRLLPGYYQATTRLLYQEPRARHSAKQHRRSSPARLPAPLNPAARSRRRRSAQCARKISRRPSSTCRTSRPTPESTHATRP